MSSDRFRAVRDAVARVRTLEGAARQAFLASLDPAVRADVESLLSHDETPAEIVRTGALARGIGKRLRPALEMLRRAGLPEVIGPYRIREVIGEGGMGVVLRAEQTAPIRREVALKLLHQIGDAERVRIRFESELQTLAAMNHPGIAKVFDAGVHEGRPFFVMELVPGVHVTEFCETHAVGLRSRLEIFLEICHAVRHAHQRGVIHRDIKPSNVLVGEIDGVRFVKVIDFGIALVTERRGGATGALVEALGTPAYMSPEQARRGDGSIDTRTDVYSLGVLLYELLTRKLPYEITADTTADTLAEVAAREPPEPPSRVTSSRALAGDLDAIALKSIAAVREQRYDSVEQLAADVRFHLDGHPVLARGDGAGYRARKFIGRHPMGVTVAGLFVLLLVGFTMTTAIQSRRIAAERNRAVAAERSARTEAETTGEVLDFMIGVFDVANPSSTGGEDMTVRQVLEAGVTRIRTELVSKPEIRARLLHTLGEVYHALGSVDRSTELAQEALEIRRDHYGNEHVEVAESLQLLSTLAHDNGEYERAFQLGEQSLAIRTALLGTMDADAATTLSGMGSSTQAMGRPGDAEPYLRRALEIHRATLGEKDPEVAWDLNLLGWSLHAQGKLRDAEPLYEEALAVLRAAHGERHPDVAGTLNNLAGLRMNLGDVRGGEVGFREALDIYRSLYDDDHAAVARAHANHAWALRELGDYDASLDHAREALAINRRVLGDAHPYTAATLTTVGRALAGQGAVEESEASFRESLAIREELGLADHPSQASARLSLAKLLLDTCRYDAAEREVRRAMEILEQADRASGDSYGEALLVLGRTRLERSAGAPRAPDGTPAGDNRDGETEKILRRALEILVSDRPPAHYDAARARVTLGLALLANGRAEARAEARGLIEQGQKDLAATLGTEHPSTRWATECLARLDASGD